MSKHHDNSTVIIRQYPHATADTNLSQIHTTVQQPTIILHQPTSAPWMQHGQRDWSSGLCACTEDCSSCCCILWFGHCYLCYMYSQYGEYCGTPMCVGLSDMSLRTQHRNRFGIRGTILGDFCCTLWCCKIAQCRLMRDMNYVRDELKQDLY